MNFIRKIVSGKKRRFKKDKFNLDLSYITPRIIAMALPATGFSKAYRNKINDVAAFFKKYHGEHYRIYNLCEKRYPHALLENRVKIFPWKDHHPPTLKVIFEVVNDIHNFLKEDIKNTVAVHCLAGKGRTGTIICSYLLHTTLFNNVHVARQYEKVKRFEQGGGVTQRGQIRYIDYFYKKLTQPEKYQAKLKILKKIVIRRVPRFGKNGRFKPILEIVHASNNYQLIYEEKNLENNVYQESKQNPKISISFHTQGKLIIAGDIIIRIYHQGLFLRKKIGWYAFNTSFIPENNILSVPVDQMDPDTYINKNINKFPKDFSIDIFFKDVPMPLAPNSFQEKLLKFEQENYSFINTWIKNRKAPTLDESQILLFSHKSKNDMQQWLKNIPFQQQQEERKVEEFHENIEQPLQTGEKMIEQNLQEQQQQEESKEDIFQEIETRKRKKTGEKTLDHEFQH